MGADEVAVIRPSLLELEADLAEGGDPSSGPLCATFEVEPECTRWLQVVFGRPDTLNLYYPFQEPPEEKLLCVRGGRPAGFRLTNHEPGSFATFSFERPSAMELARFLDSVFIDLLGCSDEEYPLTVKLFRLPK